MSAQRFALSFRDQFNGLGRPLRFAAGLIVLAMPLAGCGTGSLLDKFTTKDETFVDEPADKSHDATPSSHGCHLVSAASLP